MTIENEEERLANWQDWGDHNIPTCRRSPMRSSSASYQAVISELTSALPQLRPAQQRGLALWVYGTILAGSACQTMVIAALTVRGYTEYAVRQLLREWLYDGTDKAAPCATQVSVTACFVPVLRWVLRHWQSDRLALAVDVTSQGPTLTAIVISVLYRGCALPVAWVILPGGTKGEWMRQILRLLRQLAPAILPEMTVLVLADRGLWSPRLWKRLKDLGWHPLLRVIGSITFAPTGGRRQSARALLSGPGSAWVGGGTAFKDRRTRRSATLVALWEEDHDDPILCLTDLAPEQAGVSWYGLRMWIELGFKVLKSLGWQWQRTRRTDPERVARHWLVLACATVLTLQTGTRVEDAERVGMPPTVLHQPPRRPCWRPCGTKRTVSVFRRGLAALQVQVQQGRLWSRRWFLPEPWPDIPPGLVVVIHTL